jgi:formylglycine-generating enzyme required for sulfatase activity
MQLTGETGLALPTWSSDPRFPDPFPPPFASAWGDDNYGLWAALELPAGGREVVSQYLRWIPPGRFLMGSPEGEEGRWGGEAPRHEVTLAEGFWLFDTPCTQALWQAVMGENPSRFKSPTRPVEQVSFEDVQAFLDKLNALVPGLDLGLPSEAQWEYACRAETDTATYAGDMRIVGERNAPVLDAIAWYGGNSGVGFELDNGYDSSEWKEKQYEHTRAGTRPVAQKAANPWGLYDMLGNVWEWCGDRWHDSYKGAPTDGSAWIDPGGAANRVVRGGSWISDARFVRAAFRYRHDPAVRDDDIGFRCARVQVANQVGGSAQVAAPADPARRPGAERGRP